MFPNSEIEKQNQTMGRLSTRLPFPTFGVPEPLKGFFSYKFYTRENLNYVGTPPPIEYFETSRLSAERLEELKRWHEGRCVEAVALQPGGESPL